MNPREAMLRRLIWLAVFGAAFAMVEASVVVYLRALYYPVGFTFPLKEIPRPHLAVELGREAATIVMLVAAGMITGTTAWSKFAGFLVAFGVWDILFYVWLKVLVDWPLSIVDWDILFLLPAPWIGPVIAPVSIAMLMVVLGADLALRESAGAAFRPGVDSWVCGVGGTAVLLFSFMRDTDAGLRGAMPEPYRFELLVAGIVLYVVGYVLARRRRWDRTLATGKG
ncbi:MAG: hypothetical protein AB1428_11450 [Bacteroidota bacterium]